MIVFVWWDSVVADESISTLASLSSLQVLSRSFFVIFFIVNLYFWWIEVLVLMECSQLTGLAFADLPTLTSLQTLVLCSCTGLTDRGVQVYIIIVINIKRSATDSLEFVPSNARIIAFQSIEK
jgi:hypothetical protein